MADFYYYRGLWRLHTPTCIIMQKQLTGFSVFLLFFLKSKAYTKLSLKNMIELNRSLYAVTYGDKIPDKIVAAYYQCKTIQSLLYSTGSKVPFTYLGCVVVALHNYSLAHKSNFAGHVIITTGLLRMHFPHPGIILRWNLNL